MTAVLAERHHEFKVFHMCGGSGFGGLGFKRGHARIGRATASFRTLGNVDNDPVACEDYRRIVGAPATVLDLFSAAQYTAFHGRPPPPDWREATADDIRAAAGGEFPDVVFWSPPCKGLSSLLNAALSTSLKYQALNELVLRALDLFLEAFEDDLPSLVLLENVPRIQTRGRALLDAVKLRLELAGYAVAETVHDCGELGGLAQHRQRFLLVARHRKKVRPFLYEPERRPVRGVGEVIGALPMPDDPAAGPMHRLPRLQWQTWVRLALIEAGSDWRSLNRLKIADGVVEGLAIVPEAEWHNGVLGVRRWEDPAVTITGESLPYNGAFTVADPRPPRDLGDYQPYGVVAWDQAGHTVTGTAAPGAGAYSVADPRAGAGWDGKGKYITTGWDQPVPAVIAGSSTGQGAFTVADPRPPRGMGEHSGKMRVESWDQPAHTITGSDRVGSGAMSVGDPRVGDGKFNDCFRVLRWDQAAQAVTGSGTPSAGGQAIADPRVGSKTEGGEFASARHYGVLRWDDPSPAVTGSACHDNGAHSVADPRRRAATERCAPWIWSLDGTRHRPFTTLDLVALQGFPLEDILGLRMGGSDSLIREHTGNGVPVAAATAMADTFLHTLLAARLGQHFSLSAAPIWVDRRLAVAVSADL